MRRNILIGIVIVGVVVLGLVLSSQISQPYRPNPPQTIHNPYVK